MYVSREPEEGESWWRWPAGDRTVSGDRFPAKPVATTVRSTDMARTFSQFQNQHNIRSKLSISVPISPILPISNLFVRTIEAIQTYSRQFRPPYRRRSTAVGFRRSTYWDTEDDAPGPRCAHTLTAIAPTKSHGPRLILSGGASSPIPDIRNFINLF
ncbi:hypothetical protein SSX86_032805 [Deinandra increscens subsp. villosa]|uniref:Uncharacterized protein n=1 Tax=Deinandra increscens subsp. villosa TaxID=3103831 RepID=A0AAP0C752_9ASTR